MAFGPVASISVAAGLLGLMVPCAASRWHAKADDVETSLIAELTNLVHTGQPHRLEAMLSPIYTTLPKNAHGNLEPESVGSALHRLFMQQTAWSVKGLQPGSSVEDWVPAYLQKLVEDRVGKRGVGLRELAVLAASLEDMTRKEATARLERAYQSQKLPVTGRSNRAEVLRALRLYAEDYLGNGASEEWLERLEADQWKAGETADGRLGFQDASRAVLLMEQQLSRFKSQECSNFEPEATQSRCLDVSSLYSLCCRSNAEGPSSVVHEPSVWVAALTEYPGMWTFSLVCFLLTAVLNACRWLCGGPGVEGPAQSEESSKDDNNSEEAAKEAAANPQEEAAPTGMLGTCMALCLVCAAAVAADLLDITVVAPALAMGLALLAAARLAQKQHVKAKKV